MQQQHLLAHAYGTVQHHKELQLGFYELRPVARARSVPHSDLGELVNCTTSQVLQVRLRQSFQHK